MPPRNLRYAADDCNHTLTTPDHQYGFKANDVSIPQKHVLKEVGYTWIRRHYGTMVETEQTLF